MDGIRRSEVDGEIRKLEPHEVGKLRLTWDSRHTTAELRRMAESTDWLLPWNTRTGEYLVAGPWRHRSEILEIVDVAATGGAIELLQFAVSFVEADNVDLLIVPERHERRREQFYASAGFEPLQEIIIYELHNLRPPRRRPMSPAFTKVDLGDQAQRSALIQLDHDAFPWLWWNSEAEFDNYAASNGVEIEMALDRTGAPLAYVGYTRLRGWGHLDRIAVAPQAQGTGIGRAALEYAVASMISTGARRIGLSTQAENQVSRALYESYGFKRNPAHDYRLYGRWTGERRQF